MSRQGCMQAGKAAGHSGPAWGLWEGVWNRFMEHRMTQAPGWLWRPVPKGVNVALHSGTWTACWFRSGFPARTERCVCEPGAAFLVASGLRGHFQLSRTQGGTPSSVPLQLRKLHVAGWELQRKATWPSKTVPCPASCLLSRPISLAADPRGSASHQVWPRVVLVPSCAAHLQYLNQGGTFPPAAGAFTCLWRPRRSKPVGTSLPASTSAPGKSQRKRI